MDKTIKHITGAAIVALGVFFLLRVINSVTWDFSLAQLLQFAFKATPSVAVSLIGLSALRTEPQPAQTAIPESEPMMVWGAALALITGIAGSLAWPALWTLTFIGVSAFSVGSMSLKTLGHPDN